jgi:hypothetical protein
MYGSRVFRLFLWRSILNFTAGDIDYQLGELGGVNVGVWRISKADHIPFLERIP